ncbi:MAG TPA: hypothetical protein GXZ89_04030 [Fastidiosipila sp.]|nr:hypothetical protein [Fastidiosipila sp.]
MKKQEFRYFFMTPIFLLAIFCLTFIQILTFAVQKDQQASSQAIEESNWQQLAALSHMVAEMMMERLKESPPEAFSDFRPEGMNAKEYEKLHEKYWQRNAELAQENYEFVNANIHSSESLHAKTAFFIFLWQTSTQFSHAYMKREEKPHLDTPAEYFGDARWAEIKETFDLSDYEGILVADFGTSDLRQGLQQAWHKYGSLYHLRLYEEGHLPVSRFSTNGFIAGIFQRDYIYNAVCLVLTIALSIMAFMTLEQNQLKRLYYLSLGRRRFYQHRFSLLFLVSFLPIFFTEALIMLLRNWREPGVSLSYPVMTFSLTENLDYASRLHMIEGELAPLPIDIHEITDFLKLDIYPVWLILLLSVAYLVIMIALVVSLLNYVYSVWATKRFTTITLGMSVVIVPLLLLLSLYPLDQLSYLLDMSKLLQGKGPWPYAYTLAGFAAYTLLIYFIGSGMYAKTKMID